MRSSCTRARCRRACGPRRPQGARWASGPRGASSRLRWSTSLLPAGASHSSRRGARSDVPARAPTSTSVGTCKHLVALAYLFAEAIDDDPSLLLRWRGCLAETAAPVAATEAPATAHEETATDDDPDPWVGGPVPEIGPARSLPVGAVLKRLGPSGLRLDGVELIELLEPAYAAFARVELPRHGSASIDE